MSKLRYGVAAIALVFAGLPGYTVAASYSLAHSKSEGVEVLVDHADGQPWCSASLKLRFAFSATPPAGAVERLMPKIGSLLNGQCAQAVTADWYSVNASGVRVGQGSASKAEAWAPRQAAVDLSAPPPAPTSAVAAQSVAAASIAQSAASPDVVGIRIGMTEAEVRRLLELSETKYKISSSTWSVPDISPEKMTYSISATAPTEALSIAIAPLPQAVVIGVQREMTFRSESRPAASSIAEALEQKYGAPSQVSNEAGYGQRRWWYFDAAGNLRGSIPNGRCDGMTINRRYFRDGTPTAEMGSRAAGGGPECGLFIYSRIDFDSNGISDRFTVFMGDPALGAQLYKASNEVVVNAREARRQAEILKAQQQAAPAL